MAVGFLPNIDPTATLSVYGRNAAVALNTLEDVWSGSSAYAFPTTARVHAIVSASANDTAAGTGLRTVLVEGIGADYLPLSEVVTLNGTTSVNTTGSYLRINLLKGLTAGTGTKNAGAITATAATDSTVSARIEAGMNRSESTVFTIASGRTAYLLSWWAHINKAQITTGCDMSLLISENINVSGTIGWQYRQVNGLVSLGKSNFQHVFTAPIPIIGPADIKINAYAGVAAMDISAGYDLAFV